MGLITVYMEITIIAMGYGINNGIKNGMNVDTLW